MSKFHLFHRYDSGSSLANHMTTEHGIVAKFTAGKEKRYEMVSAAGPSGGINAATNVSSDASAQGRGCDNGGRGSKNPFKVPKLKTQKKANGKVKFHWPAIKK